MDQKSIKEKSDDSEPTKKKKTNNFEFNHPQTSNSRPYNDSRTKPSNNQEKRSTSFHTNKTIGNQARNTSYQKKEKNPNTAPQHLMNLKPNFSQDTSNFKKAPVRDNWQFKNQQRNQNPNGNRNEHRNEQRNEQRFRPNRGNNYEHQHGRETENATQKNQVPKLASSGVNKFWDQLVKRVLQLKRKNKFELLPDEYPLWQETWKAAAGGASGPIRVLPIAYLMLPATVSLSPEPTTTVSVLFKITEQIKHQKDIKNPKKEDFATVNVLEAVLDTIKLRLCNQIQTSFFNIKILLNSTNQLEKNLFDTILQTMSAFPEDSDRLIKLLTRKTEIKELIKRIETKSKQRDITTAGEHESNEQQQAWLGWQKKPTLGWLMSGSWQQTEGLKAFYNSSHEYTETLLRVWTQLTFYWGSGTVWPRCCHKQGTGDLNACGEPLLGRSGLGNNTICRRTGCSGVGVWKCFRNGHDAVCEVCLVKQQDVLVGEPGSQASTDIYDAVVCGEVARREEAVYLLKNLASRKPPKIAPNWKTSYRLPVTALVAIIKLSVCGEVISRDSPIQWAEVVPYENHAGANQDWQQRSQGHMAIRLLTRADCTGMPDISEAHIDVSTSVAIIDLRVFVPEVISVLNTLARPDFGDQLAQIPFFDRLIGHESTQVPMKKLENEQSEPIEACIRIALEGSEIDFVQRLNPYARSELIREICALRPIQTLSGTQLDAFAAALFSAVHCTQGPPGTGKSYIGVCLVLALDLIRTKAEANGHAGVGPVLVLSYKNHALDEFLIDIQHQYESSFGQQRRVLRPGMLLRTGKPDIDSLNMFTEKHSPLERHAQDHLASIINVLRTSRNIVKSLYDCARTLDSKALLEYEGLDWFPPNTKHLKETKQTANSPCFASIALCRALELVTLLNSEIKEATANASNVEDKLETVILQRINPHNVFSMLRLSTNNAFINQLNDIDPQILDLMMGISKNLEHWKEVPRDQTNLYFFISSWLKGATPPPRCQALVNNEEFCLEEANPNSTYCDLLHRCKSSLRGEVCTKKRVHNKGPFCIEHNCTLAECKSERFVTAYDVISNYCSKHVCVKCLWSNSKSIMCRSQCSRHECKQTGCRKLQVLDSLSSFCIDHVCVECILDGPATDDQGKKYIQPRMASTLCKYHKCGVPNCDFKRYSQDRCIYHICRICASTKDQILRVSDPQCPQSQLCSELHRCQYSEHCQNERLYSPTAIYCVHHSCKECVQLKSDKINAAISKAPRNACKSHPLCNFLDLRGRECNARAQNASLYCMEHNIYKSLGTTNEATIDGDKKCAGVTRKNKKPCGAKPTIQYGISWYCQAHKDQAPKDAPVQDSDNLDDNDADEEQDEIKENEARELKPVLSIKVNKERLEQYECSARLSKNEKCGTVIFLKDHNEASWLCVIHEKRTKQPNKTDVFEKFEKFENEEKLKTKDVDKKIVDTKDSTSKDKSEVNKREIELNPSEKKDMKVKLAELVEIFEDAEVDFKEADGVNTHPDEMDDDYYLEEGINEELKRLQEVTEIENNSEDEYYSDPESELESEKLLNDQNPTTVNDQDMTITDILCRLTHWSWKWNRSERLSAASRFLRQVALIYKLLSKLCETFVLTEARKLKAEAGAQAFRNARIVGSTVVGASRRLEAMRAAGPFAVVVEEACEVIEPTLMSVLACNTLRKLELIGDHRQLPAFVQQCWFSFETTMPSIKTSLFERLVSGTVRRRNNNYGNRRDNNKGVVLPFTILDEQRRMRTSIADLTKPDYNDIVQIIDHPNTGKQCIGDVVARSCSDKTQVDNLRKHRTLWPTRGRSVPGLAQNIFFWDLPNNAESRPIAGLSACNLAEAEAVAGLTKWLLLCGCPPASISIITPYKGQKTQITNVLRKNGCIRPFRKEFPPPRGTTISVSTVDRFQGDENDIVILSLVRCSPGNRFVGLQNRFVVGVSRARLGFFIVGSVKAVTENRNGADGPAHWRRLIQTLNPDSSSTLARCGSNLPICCPRHLDQTPHREIHKPSEFPVDESNWHKFCSLPCQAVLSRCGHKCLLKCHSPVDTCHNQECKVELKRPCNLHSEVPLLCHELDIGKQQTVESALRRFECKIQVNYDRPECEHIVQVTCHSKTLILSGNGALDECDVVVSDYIHPVCNHRFSKPSCVKKREYERCIPQCVKIDREPFKRPCGCIVENMPCFKRLQEMKAPSKCMSSIELPRPRCGHQLSLRCCFARDLLARWEEQQSESALHYETKKLVIVHGKKYGPPESALFPQIIPECLVPANFIGPCSHQSLVPCTKAFNYASNLTPLPECNTPQRFTCPVCNSTDCECPCWLAKLLSRWRIWTDEEQTPSKNSNGFIRVNEFAVLNNRIFGRIVLPPDLPMKGLKLLPNLCKSRIQIIRTCSPLHMGTITCPDLLKLLLRTSDLSVCNAIIDRKLPCGHIIKVDCSARDLNPPPVCSEKVDKVFTYPCGIHSFKPGVCSKYTKLIQMESPKCMAMVKSRRYRCGHGINISCYLKQVAEQPSPGCTLSKEANETNPNRIAQQSIVDSNIGYCAPELFPTDIPDCTELVSYRYRSCNHIRPSVPCSLAFMWAADEDRAQLCEHLINNFISPICGHNTKAICFETDILLDWKPWAHQKKPELTKYVTNMNELNEPIIAYSINEADLKSINLSLPQAVTKSSLECQVEFSIHRTCGHTLITTCSKAYSRTYPLCRDFVPVECLKNDCKHVRNVECHIYASERRSGRPFICEQPVLKRCEKCNVNKLEVACCKAAIDCHSEAHATLLCGHEVAWLCGSDQDPRLNPKECQACVYPLWEKLIGEDTKLDVEKALMTQALENITNILDCFEKGEFRTMENEDFDLNLINHVKCRAQIVGRYVESAKRTAKKITVPKNNSLCDIKFYELVFIQVEADRKSCLFEQKPTKYGRGYELTRLSKCALNRCKPDEDGNILVMVGAVFRFNASSYSPPFCASLNNKGIKSANITSTVQREAGFDYIPTSALDSDVKEYVFWEPGACIALALVSFKNCEQCNICLEYSTPEKGFACAKNHFMCWECLEEHVKHASAPDSVGKSINDKNGNLYCPYPDCNEEITLLDVAKEPRIFSLIEKMKTDFESKKAVDKALKEQEARLKREHDRLMAIADEEERNAARIRLDIVENVLTLRCPRCKVAFLDYEGCAALTCSNCRAGFCSMCLKDCGHDAHAHVVHCPQNNTRSVYVREEVFKEHHRLRQENIINKRLRELPAKTRGLLLNRINKELADLRINIDVQLLNNQEPKTKFSFFRNIFKK